MLGLKRGEISRTGTLSVFGSGMTRVTPLIKKETKEKISIIVHIKLQKKEKKKNPLLMCL